jgi:hypothetical protein
LARARASEGSVDPVFLAEGQLIAASSSLDIRQ